MGQFSPSSPVITGAGGGSPTYCASTIPGTFVGGLGGDVPPPSVPPAGSSPLACAEVPMGGYPSPAEAMGPKGDSSSWSPLAVRCLGAPHTAHPPPCATASTPAHPWPAARFGWHVTPLAGLQLGSCVHKQPSMDLCPASILPWRASLCQLGGTEGTARHGHRHHILPRQQEKQTQTEPSPWVPFP